MKTIELTQGEVMVVDDCDFELLSKFKWHVLKDRNGYKTAIVMLRASRAIAGNVPSGMVVDHINGDSLDNRRENLRITNRRDNCLNSKRNRDGGLPGVDFNSGKWRARYNRKELGRFDDKFEAYNAYVNKYLEVN